MKGTEDLYPWINPVGGYGDMLMVSGVLKLVVERNPDRRFNLVRRTSYLFMFKGHPAIDTVGYPPKDAEIVHTTYWSMEEIGPGTQRPFQILARSFGLPTPIPETLNLPETPDTDPLLMRHLPIAGRRIVISISSDSPRKTIKPDKWDGIVKKLRQDGNTVIQVGRADDLHIRPAVSLLGLTTPGQLVALLRTSDAVITCDNFIMHAAHLARTPAIVIWGPTRYEIYGYDDQVHIQLPKMCDEQESIECIGPKRNNGGRLYGTTCPLGEKHCLDQIDPDRIYEKVTDLITRS